MIGWLVVAVVVVISVGVGYRFRAFGEIREALDFLCVDEDPWWPASEDDEVPR